MARNARFIVGSYGARLGPHSVTTTFTKVETNALRLRARPSATLGVGLGWEVRPKRPSKLRRNLRAGRKVRRPNAIVLPLK